MIVSSWLMGVGGCGAECGADLYSQRRNLDAQREQTGFFISHRRFAFAQGIHDFCLDRGVCVVMMTERCGGGQAVGVLVEFACKLVMRDGVWIQGFL